MKKFKRGFMGFWFFFLMVFTLSVTNIYAQVNRGVGVSVEALPGEFKGLNVRDYFVPSSQKKVGVVHAIRGSAVVVHRSSQKAYFAMAGDTIYEDDSVNTLAKSRCRIRFSDEDIVTMAPNTEFSVESFEDQRKKGKKKSLFSMLKGKAMFYAMRLFKYKDSRFKLKTPTVTVGVRGTKFGAHVYWEDEEKASYDGIKVADTGDEVGKYLAWTGSGGGGQSFTDCHSEDGDLDIERDGVIAAVVNPDEMWKGDIGQKINTPEGYAERFHKDTEVRVEVVAKGKKVVVTDVVTDTGEPALGDAAELLADILTVTETQTGTGTVIVIEHDEEVVDKFAPPLYGYFSAFLIYHSSKDVKDAFLSTGLFPMDPLDAEGDGVINPADDLDPEEEGSNEYADATIDGNHSDNINITGPTTYLGEYDYLRWGYHESNNPVTFNVAGTDYDLINKQWFVEGIPTCPSHLATLSGDYTYSGVAYGTYYDTSETVDLSGDYSSKVHFGSSYIHDFQLDVSGGGHTVEITQSGNATVNSYGEFQIDTGLFKIDACSISDWRVNGAHFGNNPAAEQGGVWGGADTACFNNGAYGNFAGRKQ